MGLRQPLFSLLLNLLVLLALDRLFLRSKVEPYVKVVPNETEPLVKRVVLIVADGLRYDVTLSGWKHNQEAPVIFPYLKAKLDNDPNCTCGVSFSQAPTESRACHTAMLAGFWEDMANAKERWRKPHNPDFDHVLKKANFSLAIGGPDVVDFFPGPNVEIHSFPYSHYKTTARTEDLDLWTVERFEQILADPKNAEKLESSGNIYFLHLAGVDTAGHRHGPFSEFYRSNAGNVDGLIRRIEDSVRNRFHDDNTAYIFTSDHGFADTGGHGAGDYNTVKCPLFLWGSNSFVTELELRKSCDSNTIKQTSIHALISMLLAIPYSSNNIYGLPTNILSFKDDFDAIARLNPNMLQLYTHLRAKQDRIKSKSILFTVLNFFVKLPKIQPTTQLAEMLDNINCFERQLKDIDNFVPMIVNVLLVATAMALVVIADMDIQLELNVTPSMLLDVLIGALVEFHVVVTLVVALCLLTLASLRPVSYGTPEFKATSILKIILTITLMALGTLQNAFIFVALIVNFGHPIAKQTRSDLWALYLKAVSAVVSSVPLSQYGTFYSIMLVIAIQSIKLRKYIGNCTPGCIQHILTLMNLAMCLVAPFQLYTAISLALIVGHIAAIIWSQHDVCWESLGLHVLCLVSRGFHLGIFPLLSALASLGLEAPSYGSELLPTNTKLSHQIKTSILSIQILLLVIASVFLPIGLHITEGLGKTEYRRPFGLESGVVLGIAKTIMTLFILCSIDREVVSGRLERIFCMTSAFGLGIASILARILSPVGSWLEIGTSIASYVVALTVPIAILVVLFLHTTVLGAITREPQNSPL